jgi:hypothetical protein
MSCGAGVQQHRVEEGSGKLTIRQNQAQTLRRGAGWLAEGELQNEKDDDDDVRCE